MKILVTGGCGFIGSHFIRTTLAERPEWDIINLDALTYAGNLVNTVDFQTNPHYKFVYGSITNKELVDRLVSEVDAVAHFAAETHVDRSIVDVEPFILTNVLGTQRLIDACIRFKKRIHHVSTDEVFGSLSPVDAKFSETTPYNPRNPYSATKAASDHLVRAAVETHNLQATISNCTNNYGAFLYPEKALSIWITNLLEGECIPIHGDGNQVRDWIYAGDHARGVLAILERGRMGETYMMGGDSEMTILDTAKSLLKVMGLKESLLEFLPDRPGQDKRYAIAFDKIQSELGWNPQVTFEQGLGEMVEWYRKNEWWWKPIKDSAQYREWYRKHFGPKCL